LRTPSEQRQRRIYIGLIGLSALGVALWQPFTLPQLLDWGAWLVHQPWAIALLIALQAVLYSLALPGTAVVWLVAPFHAPLFSIAALLLGSVSGALGGYLVSSRLSEGWQPRRGAWLLRLLTQRSDFFTQFALRVLPGCPHWAVNYGGGILRVPLTSFMCAAVLGLGIKMSLYVWVIYNTANAAQIGADIGLATLWPLLLLATTLVAGSFIRQRMVLRSERAKGLSSD